MKSPNFFSKILSHPVGMLLDINTNFWPAQENVEIFEITECCTVLPNNNDVYLTKISDSAFNVNIKDSFFINSYLMLCF